MHGERGSLKPRKRNENTNYSVGIPKHRYSGGLLLLDFNPLASWPAPRDAPLPMADWHDWNDLDRAIFALTRSTAALPEVYRRLIEGRLCALVPYHPEVVDATIQIQNGSPFHFVMTSDEQGEAVMLSSSDARAENR
jgi:hypothetical protein